MCHSAIENDHLYHNITRDYMHKLHSALVVSIRRAKYRILITKKLLHLKFDYSFNVLQVIPITRVCYNV